jgi:hypothetical protein
MLREIRNVKQTDAQLTRRWFQSDYFDLFIWFDPANAVKSFQLCYDLRRRERALTWKDALGYFHDGVDDGESEGPAGPNASGLLTGASRGPFDAEKVNSRFMRESADMPIELRSFVLGKLHDYALNGQILRREAPRRVVRRDEWQKAGEAGAVPEDVPTPPPAGLADPVDAADDGAA